MTVSKAAFDTVEFLRQLIAIPSCDPPGREIEVARAVHEALRTHHVDATIDEFAPGRANVLGRVRGRGSKPTLVFSSHLDTVPVGTQPWSFPPFGAEISQGRILGRGASDMKGAVAAMVAAAIALAQRETGLAGDVVLAFSAGESSNCLGAKRFVERGLQQNMGALLVGEPSSLDVIIAEKAALWLRLTAKGRLGHVSGDGGINAITLMMGYLGTLSKLALPYPAHPLVDGPTLRVGRIEGGSAVNITPDACHAEIDIRLPPGTVPKAVIEMLSAEAPSEITVEIMDFKPAVESSPNIPFVKLCVDICREETALEPSIKGVSYFSDATVLVHGTDIPFAIIGPGDLGKSGQPDESVAIDKVLVAARIYERIAGQWLS